MGEKPGGVLTIDELALYLKIPKSTLYKLVREGKIPSQKIGRHWRFRKGTIDRWLDDLPTGSSEPAEAHPIKQDSRESSNGRAPRRQGHS